MGILRTLLTSRETKSRQQRYNVAEQHGLDREGTKPSVEQLRSLSEALKSSEGVPDRSRNLGRPRSSFYNAVTRRDHCVQVEGVRKKVTALLRNPLRSRLEKGS